ncbi:MAG: hypothetical protein EZS28_052652 [Streblomastix strix]|uniref:Reverse transcriptase domain-containing protein n=1 Tax=Streblomastix strix TaxID=222440 RepID=A0A5J4S112_9EUKA|nr:MAG: hypothetical protein EZS28_052652 [Streblomastix strix]
MKQPRQFKGNLIQEQEYQNQLNEELKNGIIKETNSIQVYNPTFIVRRKDGRLRKMLECRRIKFFTKHVYFKMDGAEQLKQILQQSDYATILDIKDAFHHIHVQPNLQQFLGFKFKNKSYTDTSNQNKVENLDITLYGRHNFNSSFKGHFETNNTRCNSLPIEPRLAPLIQQVCFNSQDDYLIPRLIIPNCINGGNNDTKQKKRDEEQTKTMDPNDKLKINYDKQKFGILEWRYQLPSISIPSNITLDELPEQPKI